MKVKTAAVVARMAGRHVCALRHKLAVRGEHVAAQAQAGGNVSGRDGGRPAAALHVTRC